MIRSLVVLLALPAAASHVTFDEYLRQYGKSYGGEEYDRRRALFEERVSEIAALNGRPGSTWKAAVNQFADLTPDELRRHLGYNKAMRRREAPALSRAPLAEPQEEAPPESVDWREEGVLGPVKSQGQCGSCWAFAATAAIESNIAIETGVLLSLSPQQLTSCAPNPRQCGGSGGCTGSTPELGYEYVVKAGIHEIWDYPYQSGVSGHSEGCSNETMLRVPRAGILNFETLPRNDAAALMEAIAFSGPVAVSVDAGPWFMYHEGVFDGCNHEAPDINHAVLLVGYGQENGTKYWIIQNSWGPLWGEFGFIRLKRFDEEPCGIDPKPFDGFACKAEGPNQTITACGTCGVLSDSSHPMGGYVGRRPQGQDSGSHPEFRPRVGGGYGPPGLRRLRAGASLV
mmetsp:Transcript_62489/g.183186  ORF Transcript_62489/g.183186 Transcript_62489/m.183186 type:complete len:399 (-) Transcript_62489:26-1222(-)